MHWRGSSFVIDHRRSGRARELLTRDSDQPCTLSLFLSFFSLSLSFLSLSLSKDGEQVSSSGITLIERSVSQLYRWLDQYSRTPTCAKYAYEPVINYRVNGKGRQIIITVMYPSVVGVGSPNTQEFGADNLWLQELSPQNVIMGMEI